MPRIVPQVVNYLHLQIGDLMVKYLGYALRDKEKER